MSKFNLKDELMKLADTAPLLKEREDAYSDDETRAKVDHKSNEFDKDLEFDGRRRFRAAVEDLSEFSDRYKGKSVSRKRLNKSDSEEEEEEDDDEDGLNEIDEEEEEDEDEEEVDEDDEIEEQDDDEDEEEEENEDEFETKKPKSKKDDGKDGGMNLIKFDHKEEIAKGKAVKNQLNFWDLLLDSRVKLQTLLNTVNEFPQYSYFNDLINNLTNDYKKNNEILTSENQGYLVKAINQLIELQQRLFLSDPETKYLIAELGLNEEENSENGNKRKNGDKNGNTKKKAKRSDSEEDEGDEDDENEEDEDEEEEDDDDEEIYSDTEDEMRADELKKEKKLKKLAKFDFKPIKLEQLEDYLAKVKRSFQKYRNSTIQKWYDKTRLTTGKSFQTLEKPILQQIEHILMDKDRILKRTQLKRGAYKICGKKEEAPKETVKLETINNKEKSVKDYDEEIFDDQDFYNQLLRELIDRKSNNLTDPVELTRHSIELQKLRTKTKKKVDTKASKGRKIKFDTHKPLVNFMAPIFRTTMPEEARNELFRSLFGNHITLSISNDEKSINGKSNEEIVDYSNLFKGF